jgi:hypothetical protein
MGFKQFMDLRDIDEMGKSGVRQKYSTEYRQGVDSAEHLRTVKTSLPLGI